MLLLAFYTSGSFSQELQSDEFISPEGEVLRSKWTNHNLYYYYNSTNNPTSPTYSQCLTAIQNAFSTWSQYTDFTFTRTYNLSQADIELKWDATHFQNDPDSWAASSQGKGTGTPPAYIYFNSNQTFTITSSPYNLEAVTLREIGHVLGLPYVNNSSAVMDNAYHYYTDLKPYDLIAIYNLYSFPWHITGPRLVCQNGIYKINNHPTGLTFSWNLSDNIYNNDYHCLVYSGDSCIIIRNNNYDLINATLTADIKKNNVVVYSRTKIVSAYSGFKGYYTSGNISGNINNTYYFSVRKNATTHITSANFAGGTVSYDPSATVPSSWVFNSDSETLEFFVPSNSSNPVVIYLTDGCGNSYQLYALPTSYYSLNVSNEGNSITVTLVEDDDASKDFTPDQPWTIEVINTSTGRVMNTLNPTSRSESISTIGWPKGIYVVKATIGDEELTEKVIVK